jgi:hypothetical protein
MTHRPTYNNLPLANAYPQRFTPEGRHDFMSETVQLAESRSPTRSGPTNHIYPPHQQPDFWHIPTPTYADQDPKLPHSCSSAPLASTTAPPSDFDSAHAAAPSPPIPVLRYFLTGSALRCLNVLQHLSQHLLLYPALPPATLRGLGLPGCPSTASPRLRARETNLLRIGSGTTYDDPSYCRARTLGSYPAPAGGNCCNQRRPP